MTLSPSEPLGPRHELSAFDSGQPTLDDWLRSRALASRESGAARSYVVCDGASVVAYYCLANGAVTRASAPGAVRRNMPDPVHVMLLGRLAVDRRCQRRGLGRAMLRDAILRTLNAADIAGIRAMLVHALNADAARFYRENGFAASPGDELVLMLPLAAARAALGG